MSVVEKAVEEMRLANFDPSDIEVVKEILWKFFGRWDSGGVVSVMAPVLLRLINSQPLTPLTGEPDEWIDRHQESGYPFWQNKRCFSVFKDGLGRTWDMDKPAGDRAITFPYDPRTSLPPSCVLEIDVQGAERP